MKNDGLMMAFVFWVNDGFLVLGGFGLMGLVFGLMMGSGDGFT